MKLVKKGTSRFNQWVGEKVTCSKTRDELQFEESDIASIQKADIERRPGQSYPQEYISCPSCEGKITMEYNQKDGKYLMHS